MHMSEHLKQQIQAKVQERNRLESSIAECSARLEAAGVGLKGKLVDAEGFPRADVDVAAARANRQKIAVLINDHKAVTSVIEQLVHELHAEVRTAQQVPGAQPARTAQPSASAAHAAASSAAQPHQLPFAVVDEVSTSSPAEDAGIKLGDQLISFAGITKQASNTLPAVAAALQANENVEVVATVLRQGTSSSLRLTPRKWAGRGLLGCHLQPLQ